MALHGGVERGRARGFAARGADKMVRDDAADSGFCKGMAGETEHSTTVVQRDDQVAAVATHRCDFAPRNAHVQCAAEFQPAARQEEMTELVGPPAAEAHRRYEVARVTGRQRLETVDNGKLPPFELCLDLDRLEACPEVGKFLAYVVVTEAKLAGAREHPLERVPRGAFRKPAEFVTELREPSDVWATRFGFAWEHHRESQR